MVYCSACGKEVQEDSNYCRHCGAPVNVDTEDYTVAGDQVVDRVKDLIREGNVTRIIVRTEEGRTLLDIPITAGAVGTVIFPWMAALGVVAALVTRCKISVQRKR